MAKPIDISELDFRMKGASAIKRDDVVYYDVKEAPFELYGFYDPKGQDVFKRIPDDVAEATSVGVAGLYKCTAGGRVRFSTDSDCVVIRAKEPHIHRMYHATLQMSAGFDMYIDDPASGESVFYDIFKPPYDMTDNFTAMVTFHSKETRYITINFPLYGEVGELSIGLCEGATVEEGAKYINEHPVVFYGSSITQGGCASRSGIAYEAIVSRRLNIDYINLGFSGNGKAEDAIVEYMTGLDMSVFVADYDHNAPNVEYLAATHYKMYERIREAKPDIPYVMISRPDFLKRGTDMRDSVLRRRVVLDSFHKAYIENGDRNVYFIDGEGFFNGEFADCATVDGTHPNDYGMVCMANTIGNALRKLKIR
ncbi:MAG: hypothetical protein IJ011_07380 [Clostridia bacterium]|nr:hypothetical protein [Clostridia bacterium]